MGKGGAFERDFCYQLSSWWCGGQNRDDCVFWRSSQSGGRATVRARKGKRTSGHYGDICSTHKMSEPLTRFITFELKWGYSMRRFPTANVQALLDKPRKHKPTVFEEWINQARNAAENAGTPHWMLVHHRVNRETMVYFPEALEEELEFQEVDWMKAWPRLRLMLKIGGDRLQIFGTTLGKFLRLVSPDQIRRAVKKRRSWE